MPRKSAGNSRRAELAMIHIAKRRLGFDDEIYRDVLWTVCRVKSVADLDRQGRHKLISHFRSCGWQPNSPEHQNDAVSSKVWSLWYQLKDAGLIDSVSELALRAMVKKLSGHDDLRFCTDAQKSHIIECMKKWLARVR